VVDTVKAGVDAIDAISLRKKKEQEKKKNRTRNEGLLLARCEGIYPRNTGEVPEQEDEQG